MFLERIHYAFEVRITHAEAAGKPIPAAARNHFTVGDHVELTGIAGHQNRVDIQPLFDESRETRGPGCILLSRRAMMDFDLHVDVSWTEKRLSPASDSSRIRRCLSYNLGHL